MRIIISPAKKMRINTEDIAVKATPVYLDQTKSLMSYMRQLSLEECKKLWACNDQLANLNYTRFQEMKLDENLTPALIAYEGLQYQHMAPGVFSEKAYQYVADYVRILSGFYGVLRPFDGVTPYRLEMQTKMRYKEYKDLYEFWGDKLYQEIVDDDHIIINLASKEYSASIERYLNTGDQFITCVFGEFKNGKVVQKATLAKMARGEMIRFMAENNVKTPEQMKSFHELDLTFNEELSNESQYIYLRK